MNKRQLAEWDKARALAYQAALMQGHPEDAERILGLARQIADGYVPSTFAIGEAAGRIAARREMREAQ